MEKLKELLNYLESIIDVDYHNSVLELQKKTLRFEKTDKLCVRVGYPVEQFKPYPLEETHEDMAKMMYNELVGTIPTFEIKNTSFAVIRANFGVGTLPAVFGLKSQIINGNMPWVEHVSKDKVKEIINNGVPTKKSGYDQKILDTYEFYNEILAKYPNCQKAIHFSHPDFQGPLDVAHLIYGSDIYMDMYDEPELVHGLLKVVTETYIDRMKKIKPYIADESDGFNFHWSQLFPGRVLLRNDSAVNLSADMYKEFAMQYDDMIYNEFGKASMHFCGRADHWIFDMANSENILALNFGHMDNKVFGMEYLDFIAPEVMDKKKPVVGYTLTIADLDKMDFDKYSTGITYNIGTGSKKEAEEILSRYGIN